MARDRAARGSKARRELRPTAANARVAGRGCARGKANFNIRPRRLDFWGEPQSRVTLVAQPIGEAMRANQPLSRLVDRLRESNAMFATIQPAAEGALAASVRAGPARARPAESLLAANAAVAAKLAPARAALRGEAARARPPGGGDPDQGAAVVSCCKVRRLCRRQCRLSATRWRRALNSGTPLPLYPPCPLHCRPMNRRDFSSAPARRRRRLLAVTRHRRRAPRHRSRAASTRPDPAAADRRRTGEDRGARVLQLRLPALQRLRADGRPRARDPAGRRGVPSGAGGLSLQRRELPAHLLRARIMGLVEQMQPKVFAAVHVERQRLDKPEDIAALVAKNGGDATKFLAAFRVVLGRHLGHQGEEAAGRLQDRGRSGADDPRPLPDLALAGERRSAIAAPSPTRADRPRCVARPEPRSRNDEAATAPGCTGRQWTGSRSACSQRPNAALVLALASAAIEVGREHREADVNRILESWLEGPGAMLRTDHVELRRWLVDAGFVSARRLRLGLRSRRDRSGPGERAARRGDGRGAGRRRCLTRDQGPRGARLAARLSPCAEAAAASRPQGSFLVAHRNGAVHARVVRRALSTPVPLVFTGEPRA